MSVLAIAEAIVEDTVPYIMYFHADREDAPMCQSSSMSSLKWSTKNSHDVILKMQMGHVEAQPEKGFCIVSEKHYHNKSLENLQRSRIFLLADLLLPDKHSQFSLIAQTVWQLKRLPQKSEDHMGR